MYTVLNPNNFRRILATLTDLQKYEFVCGNGSGNGFGAIIEDLRSIQSNPITARDLEIAKAKQGRLNSAVKKWLLPKISGWERNTGIKVMIKFVKTEEDYINLVSDIDDYFNGL